MRKSVLILAILVGTIASPCWALWCLQREAAQVRNLENDMVEYVAVRTEVDDDSRLERRAYVTVSDSDRMLLNTPIEGTIDRGGNLEYRFRIHKSLVGTTKVEIFERQRGDDEHEEHSLRGGTIYEYKAP